MKRYQLSEYTHFKQVYYRVHSPPFNNLKTIKPKKI